MALKYGPKGKIMSKYEKKQTELVKAKQIKKTLGIRVAAGYMRNRGWSVEAAVCVLTKD